LSKGILEAIDMDKAASRIQLPDADAEIGPLPVEGGGRKPEAELDRLTNILKTFNDHFGNIEWSDEDRVQRLIAEEIPAKVSADTAYQNARKKLRQGKRPHRARQGARARDDRGAQRRH